MFVANQGIYLPTRPFPPGASQGRKLRGGTDVPAAAHPVHGLSGRMAHPATRRRERRGAR
jgi:hypothetical protein